MPGAVAAHKHTDLEQAMAELAHAQAQTQASLEGIARQADVRQARLDATLDRLARQADEREARTQANLDRLSAEMREFKGEMAEFKDEMAEFKNDTRDVGERMLRASEAADRRWGELSNKMGTLVEDFIAPGIPAIFREALGIQDEPDSWIRARRTHPKDRSRRREFDAVALGSGFLLINETKSTLRPEDIPPFLEALTEAREYWPEAEGCRVVGALASFYVEPSLVAAVEKAGLLMIGLNTGLLRILNSPGFKPREF